MFAQTVCESALFETVIWALEIFKTRYTMGISTILKIAIKTSRNINLAYVRFYHKILLKTAKFQAITIVLL